MSENKFIFYCLSFEACFVTSMVSAYSDIVWLIPFAVLGTASIFCHVLYLAAKEEESDYE